MPSTKERRKQMIKIENIDIFLKILNDLKSNASYFQLYGNLKEHGSSVSVLGADTSKVKLTARIIALTPIGTLFFEQSVKLSDETSVSELKAKLNSLEINEANINSAAAIMTIR